MGICCKGGFRRTKEPSVSFSRECDKEYQFSPTTTAFFTSHSIILFSRETAGDESDVLRCALSALLLLPLLNRRSQSVIWRPCQQPFLCPLSYHGILLFIIFCLPSASTLAVFIHSSILLCPTLFFLSSVFF